MVNPSLPLYQHPQEIWDEATCAKRARRGKGPEKGMIASSSSVYPQYGQHTRYNGGCIRNGEWYQGEAVPLPQIPDTFEFEQRLSWGTFIRRKNSAAK